MAYVVAPVLALYFCATSNPVANDCCTGGEVTQWRLQPKQGQEQLARISRVKPFSKAILPEEIEWKPFAAFPPSARLAVLVGHPLEHGPYTIRVKVPSGVKLMPHRHPEDRTYTVISGIFYIGLGNQFDADKLVAYPPGAVIILPGNTSHFHWAKSGEYVTQVTAIGPLGLEYINSKDDPRSETQPRDE